MKENQKIVIYQTEDGKEGELEQEATVKEYLTVQNEGNRKVARKVKYYNLDVIISVGYRVKSKRGTAFRIWTRNVLKDYLVKGYAVNQRIHREQIGELRQLVGMLGRTIQSQPLLSTDETNALFEVVTDYTYALVTQRLMSKVFRIMPKQTKRSNGQVLTPFVNNPPLLSVGALFCPFSLEV